MILYSILFLALQDDGDYRRDALPPQQRFRYVRLGGYSPTAIRRPRRVGVQAVRPALAGNPPGLSDNGHAAQADDDGCRPPSCPHIVSVGRFDVAVYYRGQIPDAHSMDYGRPWQGGGLCGDSR